MMARRLRIVASSAYSYVQVPRHTRMQLTLDDVLTLLLIIAVGLLILLLYHLIFVAVYLRRSSERMDELSKQIEALILRPLSSIEYIIDWVTAFFEGVAEEKTSKKKHHVKEVVVEKEEE